MNVSVNSTWLRLREKMRRMLAGPGNVEPTGPIPGRRCLAHERAECSDFTHCPDCSSLEQILRTAPWIEKNWQSVREDKGASPGAVGHDRE